MATAGEAPLILVIESDPSTRNFLVEVLHWAGFAVVAATTSAQALATVESRTINLVVSDAHPRGLSGANLLRRLRDREARCHLAATPFIMLFGEADLSATPRACCLPAPLSVGELVSTVIAMLSRR